MNSCEYKPEIHSESTDGSVSNRALAGWEIASLTSSVLMAEWIASVTAGPAMFALAVPITLAFVLAISSHLLRRESLRDLGFRLDNFVRAIRLLLPPMIVTAILCVVIAWWSGERISFARWHPDRPLFAQLILGFFWGSFQQYMLQSFVNRRAQIICGRGWLSVLVVATIFAGLHLPNLWLTVATFVGGFVWAAVYQRAPNVFALATSHAVMTWILVSTLPGSSLHHLRVGFEYFR